MAKYALITHKSIQHDLTQEEMIDSAAYLEVGEQAYAILRDGVYIYETDPNECLFCGNMKSFCICEKES